MEAIDAIHMGIAPGRELYRITRHVFIFNEETGESGEGASPSLAPLCPRCSLCKYS